MTIEQRPELNRFVDSSIPLTWNWRWRQFKMVLPIWGFICICLFEIWFVNAWLASRLNLDSFVTMIGALIFLFLFLWGMVELQIHLRHRAKRVLRIEEKRIVVAPAKNGIVRWKKVAKFQFEPIPEMPKMTKLKLFLHDRSNEKPSTRVFWQMVLENPSQTRELEHYLQTKKIESSGSYDIELLERPAVPEIPVPFPYLGLSLYMSGAYFLLHGGPALLVTLTGGNHDSHENSKFSPEQIAKLGHFFARHFSSKQELHQFFLTLNISLTVCWSCFNDFRLAADETKTTSGKRF